MLAIQTTLKRLLRYNYKFLQDYEKIVINTDSLTSIQIINNVSRKYPHIENNMNNGYAKYIIETIENLEKEKNIKVEYNHVKGHSNNLGNVFADYVATEKSLQGKNNVKISSK